MERLSQTQKIILAVAFIIGMPAIFLPFIGLLSSIAFFVGLFRYWGSWGWFFVLIVMQLFQEAGNTELRNNLKVNGADHFDSKVTVAQLALIQYGIIWIVAKSFF